VNTLQPGARQRLGGKYWFILIVRRLMWCDSERAGVSKPTATAPVVPSA